MNNVRTIFAVLSVSLLLSSCLKERVFTTTPTDPTTPDPNPVDTLAVMVNEIVARGSSQLNEFGTAEDWAELYNPSATDTLFMRANRWFFTNDFAAPTTYAITRDTFIAPRGYMMVWCDVVTTPGQQIHANFKLTGDGDRFAIYYRNNQGQLKMIDAREFGSQTSGKSTGRQTDGDATWVTFNSPTPNRRNQ